MWPFFSFSAPPGMLKGLYAEKATPVVDHRWSISGYQWQIPPSDCRLRATGGTPVAFLPLIATGGPLE